MPSAVAARADEVVEANRLVVNNVVEGLQRGALGGVSAGACHVLDPDNVHQFYPIRSQRNDPADAGG